MGEWSQTLSFYIRIFIFWQLEDALDWINSHHHTAPSYLISALLTAAVPAAIISAALSTSPCHSTHTFPSEHTTRTHPTWSKVILLLIPILKQNVPISGHFFFFFPITSICFLHNGISSHLQPCPELAFRWCHTHCHPRTMRNRLCEKQALLHGCTHLHPELYVCPFQTLALNLGWNQAAEVSELSSLNPCSSAISPGSIQITFPRIWKRSDSPNLLTIRAAEHHVPNDCHSKQERVNFG